MVQKIVTPLTKETVAQLKAGDLVEISGVVYAARDAAHKRMIELLGNQSVYDAIVAGQDPRRIADDWQVPLAKFLEVRQKYLIYK